MRSLPRPFPTQGDRPADASGRRPEAPIRSLDSEVLIDTLVAAFWNDPLYAWLFDPVDRAAALCDNFSTVLGIAHDRAHIDATPNGRGVAVWTEPGQPLMDDPAPLLEVFERWARPRLDDAAAAMDACQLHHPSNAHVLHLIGVRPGRAGRGVGTKLLEPRLATIDDADGVVYLESSNDRNHAFYRRLGFTLLGRVPIRGGPDLWPMSRLGRHEPRPGTEPGSNPGTDRAVGTDPD